MPGEYRPVETADTKGWETAERELVEYTTELIDDVIGLSVDHRSMRCSDETLSQWCELETVTLPDTYEPRSNLVLFSQRIFIRHDLIFDGELAGDEYRITLDHGAFGQDGFIPAAQSSYLFKVPRDPEEGVVALKTYTMMPDKLFPHELEDLTESEHMASATLAIKLAGIVMPQFYKFRRMSEFELVDLYETLDVVRIALSEGEPF